VQIHRDLGAQMSLAMHWGTWQLTDEGRDEPPKALAEARTAAGLAAEAFRVIAPGESAEI
jgi:N-acyl-phosphatidylethanolamine-hydrolysing phospholipase D